MILFDYPEQISDLKKYKKLGFKISLDDPYNEIYYVEFDISEGDPSSSHNLLESCMMDDLYPTLEYKNNLYNSKNGLKLLEKLSDDDNYTVIDDVISGTPLKNI